MLLPSLELAERLLVATLIGLVVGTEREWSGPVQGPKRRFAGLRTFLLLGMLGGIAGLLMNAEAMVAGCFMLFAGLAFNVVAYAMSVRRAEQSLDGTTEAAALVVLGLGVLTGFGLLGLAAGCGAIVVFALGEKERLHAWVGKIGRTEMHATLEFLVLALVIWPLLPAGPIESLWGFQPRTLWSIVLLLTAIDFLGYLARRFAGNGRGYWLTGAITGLISSTTLTLQFSRLSRKEVSHSQALGLGVLAACTVLPFRVLVVSSVINPTMAVPVLFFVIPAALVGIVANVIFLRHPQQHEKTSEEPRSPLRLGNALQLAVVFQLVFVLLKLAQARWGNPGLVGSSLLFGIMDLDALTISASRLSTADAGTHLASLAIGVGLVTNTISKLVIAAVLGSPAFRRVVIPGLAMSILAVAAMVWWCW